MTKDEHCIEVIRIFLFVDIFIGNFGILVIYTIEEKFGLWNYI